MFTGFGRVEYCDAARTCQGGGMWDLGTMLNGGFDPASSAYVSSVWAAARAWGRKDTRLDREEIKSYKYNFVLRVDCVKCEHVGIHIT